VREFGLKCQRTAWSPIVDLRVQGQGIANDA
jgi:hypothetical protein